MGPVRVPVSEYAPYQIPGILAPFQPDGRGVAVRVFPRPPMRLPLRCPSRPAVTRVLPPLLTLLAVVPDLCAQSNPPTPDDDWRNLQALFARTPANAVAAARTPAERTAARQLRATRLQQAAEQARNFYTRLVAHPHAPIARKLEIMARLESARLGSSPDATTAALALAAAFRADAEALREHRFEVALAAERLKAQAGGGAPSAPADERLPEVLLREFGPIPEVHGLFAGLAARAEIATANRLATRLLELRPPPHVKAAAEEVTARYGLVGRPLALRLTRLDATTFELPGSAAAASATVLYVWTPDHAPSAHGFNALRSLRGRLPRDVHWIYLALGVTAADAQAAATRAPFAGIHCQDDAGPRSALAQRLRVTSSPTVFVLNQHGVLTGFGRVDELPALLAAAR